MHSYVSFASDYLEGCHPAVLQRLIDTNAQQLAGYGTDEICVSARERIREACACPAADVHFLSGGTQANAVVLGALLAAWQGVVAADSGHVSGHEAGAIEHGGHKVLQLPATLGKISAAQVEACCAAWEGDENHDHMVQPGVVYISQPTEFGTLYTLAELEALSEACHAHGLRLYVDGARLAYALACKANDVSLSDLARLCDAFYIGGTKCGALIGEAVVFPNPATCPHFFTIVKQNGALLAKGRVLGVQFDALFEDGLYLRVGEPALQAADRIRSLLTEAGFELLFGSPTNQIFVNFEDATLEKLAARVGYSFWEKTDESHTLVRFATSWATTDQDVDVLADALARLA